MSQDFYYSNPFTHFISYPSSNFYFLLFSTFPNKPSLVIAGVEDGHVRISKLYNQDNNQPYLIFVQAPVESKAM